MNFLLIPDVIWSGLIASALTLSGVFFSNRSNTKRLLHQLEHDARESQKERTAALRRDVYLLAAEELTKANSYLASLIQIDLSKANPAEGLQGFFVATAKLQLVAEADTQLVVQDLLYAYSDLFSRLIFRLRPIQEEKNNILIYDNLYEKSQAEVNRILSELANFIENAKTDDRVFDALNKACNFHQQQAGKYSSASAKAHEKVKEKSVEFFHQILLEMRQMAELQIPVIQAIRKELGLDTDINAIKQKMAEQWSTQEKSIHKLLDEIK